ncbi:MAG: response regulator [candidate division Zixibacteria bacterium]|nr:response regulator [candidate division Zixibacteria bacterium]
MQVLIVDDEITNIKVINDYLANNNFSVLKAFSVKEAIRNLEKYSTIDIILCDIIMPEENGFALLKYMRENLRFKHIPVIMCSGLTDKNIVMQSIKYGAKGYIVKPFTEEQLLQKIRDGLEKGRGTVLVVDDDENIRDIVVAMVEREHYKTIQATSAEDALNLLENRNVNYIISDIMMGNMDGLEMTKIIKDKYSNIKVMLMTGYTGVYKGKSIMAQGADGFITKPFKNVEIINKLRALA